jgi:hypothetical protein
VPAPDRNRTPRLLIFHHIDRQSRALAQPSSQPAGPPAVRSFVARRR